MYRIRTAMVALASIASLVGAGCDPIAGPLPRGLRSSVVLRVGFAATTSGRIEVSNLDPAALFAGNRGRTVTDAPSTPAGEFRFVSFDVDANFSQDLVAVRGRGGASGRTEVHAYQVNPPTGGALLHVATNLGPTDPDTWRFVGLDADGDRRTDLAAMDTSGTGSPNVVIRVLRAASMFGDSPTPGTLPLAAGPGQRWELVPMDLNRDCRTDLAAILRRGGSGRSEVHVLDGASLFQRFLFQGYLGVDGSDPEVDFVSSDDDSGAVPTIYAIDRAAPEGTTLSVLEASDRFATVRRRHLVSPEPSPRDRFAFAAAAFPPLGGPVESIPPLEARQLRSAAGMSVHPCVASNLAAMVTAARVEGVHLSGTAWRSFGSQVAARRANCPDPLRSPTEACRPPTAPSGLSMHQRGLALDLRDNGASITNRGSRAYRWLAANASRFGFRNYPPEPWHWSTNGE